MDYEGYCLELLTRLTAAPSVSLHEKNVAELLKAELESLGMEVELQHLKPDSCNVVARLKSGRPGKKILLGGHIDTAPTGDGWSSDPHVLTRRGGRLYARGACDMKGGLAAQITVLKKLIDEGFPFCGEIVFLGLADEERHSIGANHWVAGAETADFGIFAEPHFDHLIIGATGKILLKLEISGTGGHAARPETGINAVDSMAYFLREIQKSFTPRYLSGEAASHCVLHIESGIGAWEYSLNIPDKCAALLNKQLLVSESPEQFIKELEELFRLSKIPGELKITREIPSYPPYAVSAKEPELNTLLSVMNRHGMYPELRINESVSDGNLIYSALGIPIVLFGPDGGNLHRENEYLEIDSLLSYCHILEDYLKTVLIAD